MAYNEQLSDRIRMALDGTDNLVEKRMFGGIVFMINGKMCLGVDKDDLLIRCLPEIADKLLSKKGARPFDLTGKPMKGWLLVSKDGASSKSDFDFWISTALEANSKITSLKKPAH